MQNSVQIWLRSAWVGSCHSPGQKAPMDLHHCGKLVPNKFRRCTMVYIDSNIIISTRIGEIVSFKAIVMV
jgi:hypothetical protein